MSKFFSEFTQVEFTSFSASQSPHYKLNKIFEDVRETINFDFVQDTFISRNNEEYYSPRFTLQHNNLSQIIMLLKKTGYSFKLSSWLNGYRLFRGVYFPRSGIQLVNVGLSTEDRFKMVCKF